MPSRFQASGADSAYGQAGGGGPECDSVPGPFAVNQANSSAPVGVNYREGEGCFVRVHMMVRRPMRFIEYSAKSPQRGTMPYQRSRGSR